MAGFASSPDLLTQIRSLQEQVRRLRTKIPDEGGTDVVHYENWIVAPPVVRNYPVAFVTGGFIIGFAWCVPVGFINLSFFHNGALVYSAGIVSGTNFHTLTTPVAVALNDQISPHVTGVFSNATEATMSFQLSVT